MDVWNTVRNDIPWGVGGIEPFSEGEEPQVCKHCDGTGEEPAETSEYPPESCSVCMGTGCEVEP